MDAELYVSILDDELQESLKYYKKKTGDIIFQQDNDLKHKSKKVTNWLNDMVLMSWYGPLNLLILVPLNTFGITLRRGLQSMKWRLGVFRNYGKEFRQNGTRFLLLSVRIQ